MKGHLLKCAGKEERGSLLRKEKVNVTCREETRTSEQGRIW